MTVRLYQDTDRERWDDYVMASDHASCYHLIGWKKVIETSFGHKTYYLLSEDKKSQLNGILPFVHLKSYLFGNFAVSLPYFNYGGICADREEIGNELLRIATDIVRSEGMEHLELRHTENTLTELSVKTAKVSMRLRLPETSETLWNSFTTKLRTKVRRTSKESMYFKLGKEDELDSFYTVFSVNMRDLGTPVYSKGFFRNILKEYPDKCWIGTIYSKENYPIGSGFLIGFKNAIEIPWASSLNKYNRYNPNALLYWNLLRFSCEKGYQLFDFGRSTPHEGTYVFKEQWGAEPAQLYWHYWLRNGGPLPEINPHNQKYGLAIKTWQKLPVWFTKAIGPSIVKHLP
jgi:serine/alanine adding enzyme